MHQCSNLCQAACPATDDLGVQVLGALGGMATEFEEAVRLGGGWAQLALPSPEDAARYFASFRRAPPDNSALVPGPQVGAQTLLLAASEPGPLAALLDC